MDITIFQMDTDGEGGSVCVCGGGRKYVQCSVAVVQLLSCV